MKHVLKCCSAALGVAISFPAMAQQPDSILQGVQVKLGQCAIAEIAMPEQIKALQGQIAAEKKRADEAEAKAMPADK